MPGLQPFSPTLLQNIENSLCWELLLPTVTGPPVERANRLLLIWRNKRGTVLSDGRGAKSDSEVRSVLQDFILWKGLSAKPVQFCKVPFWDLPYFLVMPEGDGRVRKQGGKLGNGFCTEG